jgi:hypothetical protein
MSKRIALLVVILGCLIAISVGTIGIVVMDLASYDYDYSSVDNSNLLDLNKADKPNNVPVQREIIPVEERITPEYLAKIELLDEPVREVIKRHSRKTRRKVDLSAPVVTQEVAQQVQDLEKDVRVIVSLKDAAFKQDVLSLLSAQEFELKVESDKWFAGMINNESLDKLEDNVLVQKVMIDRKLKTATAQSLPLINHNLTNLIYDGIGINGTGQSVCVVDTGVKYGHTQLGGCTGGDFSSGNCPKVIGGYDYCSSGDTCGGGEDNDPQDTNGHGTGQAGIIAADGPTYTGIAPGATIVALKVANGDYTYTSKVAQGIKYCVDNSTLYNITTVYIGVADTATIISDSFDTDCGGGDPIYDEVVAGNNRNITSIAPSGNAIFPAGGDTSGISYPAGGDCILGVASVDDGGGDYGGADIFSNWSNRHAVLDFLAPGDKINRLTLTGTGQATGTSEAAAHVAGAALLLQQYNTEIYDNPLTPTEVRDILNKTGKKITINDATPITKSRIDVFAAVHYETFLPTITLFNNNSLQDESVELQFNASDHHNLVNCTLFVDNVEDQTLTNIEKNTLQTFNLNKASGSYNYNVSCYDNSTFSNLGSSELYTINVDDDLPTITNLRPENNSVQTQPLVEFNYTATDATTSVTNCTLHINNTATLTNDTIAEGVSQYFHYNLSEGNYEWNISCYDNVSHLTTSKLFNLSVQINEPPTITLATPTAPQQEINETESITFSVTTSDPDNDILTYAWYRNNIVITGETTNSYTLTANYTDQGSHNLTVVAQDSEFSVSNEWNLTIKNLVLINEFTTDPQTDWGENGAVSPSDEWYEIYNPTDFNLNINNWNLSTVDSDINTLLLTGIIEANGYRTFVNPLGDQNNNGQIILSDANGKVLDRVVHGGAAQEAPDGNAQDVYDECIARLPENFDTNDDSADFQEQACTFNSTNTDNTAPSLSNIKNTQLTNVSALIEWTTNEFVNSSVAYSTSTPASTFALVRSHSLNLTGLTDNTEYSFNVTSCDASNNCQTSTNFVFTTINNPPVWNPTPTDQLNEELGDAFSYDVDATDTDTVTYVINDTNNFTINASSGLIENNTYLDVGTYNLQVNASDANNTITAEFKVTVVDTTAPSITAGVTTESIEFSTQGVLQDIDATDKAGIQSFVVNDTDFNIDGSGILTNNTVLAVGTYNIEVTITDNNNNVAASDGVITVQDTTNPVFTTDVATETKEFAQESTSQTVTATDDSGVTYSINYTIYFGIDTNTGAITNISEVPVGGYNIEVTATDGQANTATSLGTITVQDTTNPVITAGVISETKEFSTQGVSQAITATDASGIQSFAVNDTDFNIDGSGILTNNTQLAVGIYNLLVTITDNENNVATSSGVITVQDSTNPVITAGVLTETKEFTKQSISQTITATDDSGIQSFAVNDTDFNIDGSGVLSNNTQLAVGIHNIKVTITDNNNNEAISIGVITITDTVAPAVTNAQVNTTIEFGDDFEARIDATDVSGISLAQFLVGGIIFDMTFESGNTYAVTATNVPIGNHLGLFDVNDTAGNSNNSVFKFVTIQDTTAPTVTNAIIPNTVELGDNTLLRVDATDLSGISKAIANVSGTVYDMVLETGNTYLANISGLGVNFYSVIFQINDTEKQLNSVVIGQFNVSDTSAPTWTTTPINQDIALGNAFSYTITANDPSTPITYSLNDSTDFTIDSNTGEIKNLTSLQVLTYNLKVTAKDAFNNAETAEFSVIVGNDPPTLAGIPDANRNEDIGTIDNLVDLNDYAADPNSVDSELTYTIISQSNSAVVNCVIDNNFIDCTTQSNQNGVNQVTVKVEDPQGASANDTFSLTINAVNDAPQMSTPATQQVQEDTQATLNLNTLTTDVDSASFTYQVTNEDVNKVDCTINNNNLEMNPAQDYNGAATCDVIANDGSDDSNTVTITMNINADNDAPVLSAIPTQNLQEDSGLTTLDLNQFATDVENNALTFVLDAEDTNKVNCEINGNNLEMTPAQDYNGAASCDVHVKDTSNAVSQTRTVNIIVNSVNDAPQMNTPATQQVQEDTQATLNLNTLTADVDSVSFTYQVTNEDVNKVNCNINNNLLEMNPAQDYNGAATCDVKANDGTDNSNTVTITMNVNADNDAPVLSAIPTQNIQEDSGLNTLDLSQFATDVENDALTFVLDAEDTNKVDCNINGNNLEMTPAQDYNGPASCDVHVKDTSNAVSTTKTVTINVANVNDAPVLNTIALQSTNEDTNKQIDLANEASDIDNDPLTFEVTAQNTAQVTCSFTGSTLTINPTQDYNGAASCDVRARDSNTISTTRTVFITINAVNDEPTVSSATLSPSSATTDTLFTCTGSGKSDIENDPLTELYEFSDDSNILQAYSTTNTFSCSTTGCDKTDNIKCKYKVNDGSADSNEETSSEVTVDNTPPTLGSATLTSNTVDTNAQFTCTTNNAQDNDTDTLTRSYQFEDQSSTLQSYSTSNTYDCSNSGCDKNDQITCIAKVNDGSADSNEATSSSITVQNTAPVANNATLLPSTANIYTIFTCTGNANDLDGDSFGHEYEFSNNFVVLQNFSGASTYDCTGTCSVGNKIKCSYKANDGTTDSNIVTSSKVEVEDLPDVRVQELEIIYPNSPDTSSPTYIYFVIKNIGTKIANGVEWLLDFGDGTFTQVETIDLVADDELVVYHPVQFTTTGQHVITATTDQNAKIQEMLEDNNIQNLTVSVN